MKCLRLIVMLLIVIGALNWGLVGFFDYNFVAEIFGGEVSIGSRTVYAIIGLAGLCGITFLCCKVCGCQGDCSCCKKKGK